MRTRTDKKRAALASLMALTLAGLGCAEAKADKAAEQTATAAAAAPMPKTDRMSMADFKKMYEAGTVVVVDVRSHDAYLGGHIPGALSIPEPTINPEVAETLKKMGKPIATYCS
jgi:3-mercaptopyruvate sulfurtransferase SseA